MKTVLCSTIGYIAALAIVAVIGTGLGCSLVGTIRFEAYLTVVLLLAGVIMFCIYKGSDT